MRKTWIIIVIILVIAAAIALYYFAFMPPASQAPAGSQTAGGGPATTSPSSTAVIPVPTSTPIQQSSYGKGAETSTATKPTVVGILEGTAKPAPGKTVDIAAVKISISDPKTGKVLGTATTDATGAYKFTVTPGEYVLNIVKGTGTSAQLPQRIYVGPNQTINVNFFVQ